MPAGEQVDIGRPDPTLSIKIHSNAMKWRRSAPATTGPFLWLDYGRPAIVPCLPDWNDPGAIIAASIKRFGCEMPKRDARRMEHFRTFARMFAEKYIYTSKRGVPNVKTHAFWSTKYGKLRKRQIHDAFTGRQPVDEGLSDAKGFLKKEIMLEIKNARAIISYTDWTKAYLGPYVEQIDKHIFSTTVGAGYTFIKKVPALERVEVVSKLGDGKVFQTDFSSYEAHHFGVFAEIAAEIFTHISRKYMHPPHITEAIQIMMTSTNRIKFKTSTVELHQRLMSGALWTSSQNGLMNLLTMTYLATCGDDPSVLVDPEDMMKAIDAGKWYGLVEGDDGIFTCPHAPNDEIIKQLGLRLKIEECEHYSQASFCGVVCDSSTKQLLTSHVKFVAKLMWSLKSGTPLPDKKRAAVLKATALSYKFMYGRCPIVGPLADKVIKHFSDYSIETAVERMGQYERERFGEAILSYRAKPSLQTQDWMRDWDVSEAAEAARTPTRLLYARVFKTSIADQLRIEETIRNTNGLKFDCSLGVEESKDQFILRRLFCQPAGQSHEFRATPTNTSHTEIAKILKEGLKASVPVDKPNLHRAIIGVNVWGIDDESHL